MEIQFFKQEPEEVTDFITAGFADQHLEATDTIRQKFSTYLKENNKIIGAARGSLFGQDCYLSELVVSKHARGKGLGKKLLEEIEKYAQQSKCSYIFLDTYDYQAPDFYLKLGYAVIGKIENYRAGHARTFFRKEL